MLFPYTLFLDIDGTLLPTTFSAYYQQLHKLAPGKLPKGPFFAPHCVDILRSIIANVGMPRIVLTSNWRHDMTLQTLRQYWQYHNLPGQIDAGTPVLDNSRYNRGDEIKAYQELYDRQQEPYVILDDMGPVHFLPEQLPYLIQVDERVGLTVDMVEKISEIIFP